MKKERRRVYAAVGELVVEMTWMEVTVGHIAHLGGFGDSFMSYLAQGQGEQLFKKARAAARLIGQDGLRDELLEWLSETKKLRNERHIPAHSLTAGTDTGVWVGFRDGELIVHQREEITQLAKRARKHAKHGATLIRRMREELGRNPEGGADSVRTEVGP